MRPGFQRLTSVNEQHNEQHRLCFETPYFPRFVSTAPTTADLEDRELVYCTADNKLYINVDGTVKSSGAFS